MQMSHGLLETALSSSPRLTAHSENDQSVNISNQTISQREAKEIMIIMMDIMLYIDEERVKTRKE